MNIATGVRFNGPITIGVMIVVVVGESCMRIEMFHLCGGFQMTAARCCMRGREALPLNTSVRFENHKHFVGRCRYWMRYFGAAKFAKRITIDRITVENLHIVVGAFLMRLNLECEEMQAYAMAGCGREMPHTILFAWIVVRIVGTLDSALWSCDLILASAFLAVQSILMQHITVVARAHI